MPATGKNFEVIAVSPARKRCAGYLLKVFPKLMSPKVQLQPPCEFPRCGPLLSGSTALQINRNAGYLLNPCCNPTHFLFASSLCIFLHNKFLLSNPSLFCFSMVCLDCSGPQVMYCSWVHGPLLSQSSSFTDFAEAHSGVPGT